MLNENEMKYKKGDKQKFAYDYIKNAIIKNVYKPQTQIIESELSNELGGLSRTPIRDAIKKLEFEGLIENYPGKGAVVASVSIKDVLEIIEIRRSIELMGISLFLERAESHYINDLKLTLEKHIEAYGKGDYFTAVDFDNRFHQILASGSMNSRLESIMKQLLSESARCSFLTRFDAERVHTSIEQHKVILNALEAGDAEQARNKMMDHLNGWSKYLTEQQINKFFMFGN